MIKNKMKIKIPWYGSGTGPNDEIGFDVSVTSMTPGLIFYNLAWFSYHQEFIVYFL